MCGFAGFLQPSAPSSNPRELVATMARTIAHRGPDDSGEWCDPEAGYAVGFRRLSIIDLSSAGHQPMVSATGRYVIAFNGEVYNHERIRNKLEREGHCVAYRGRSDTEVMLAAIEAWGLDDAVTEFIGMFAFALWDRHERLLHLVRDRLGVKPLYYGLANQSFLFGSELKPLQVHPSFEAQVDRAAVALFMRHGYIPAPYTVYEHYKKLTPGSILTIASTTDRLPAPRQYWSARDVCTASARDPFEGGELELTEKLDELLKDAIGMRMVADVPLGVFLSGGIDSSLVTAIMQSLADRPVKSFSIGFEDSTYNEAQHAKSVAQHLGTDHTELYVSPEQARDVIPKLPVLYDEPFADSSQIPTFLVSELARRHVTVSLTGDGGDELFAGYNRYTYGADLWRVMRRVPGPMRRALAAGLRGVPPATWGAMLSRVDSRVPTRLRVRLPADKVAKLAAILPLEGMDAIYLALVSAWRNPSALLRGVAEHLTPLTDPSQRANVENVTLQMMYLDLVTYLPDDILVKVDRASMGVSLESREPLLDHRLVEFAWRVPMHMKSRNGVGKWLLRRVLDRYVPRALIERPKMGFGIPVGAWLRGPLRDWAEALLAERRLKDEGFFAPALVRERWAEHLAGRCDAQSELWAVLMFQAWLERAEGR